MLPVCYCMVSRDEHIIVCNICRRGLIVKDTINNGVAFLSHLKLDHGITYTPQRMTDERQRSKSVEGQMYETL
jgi:hypothetical protein